MRVKGRQRVGTGTSPLLGADVGQVEHEEEVLLLLHLRHAVHLLGGVGGGQGSGRGGRRGGFPLAVCRRRGDAALPHQSPSLPPLLGQNVLTMGQRGQTTHAQKVHFL